MRIKSLMVLALMTSHAEVGMGNEFSQVVEGRITSREWAAVVAEDLCRAFPDRTEEIVTAVGREYPEGAMTAAMAVARVAPTQAGAAAAAVSRLVPVELREAAREIVENEGRR